MKNKVALISLTVTLSLAFVFFLFKGSQPTIQKTMISRTFSNTLQPIDTLDLKTSSPYIAGLSNNTIYIGNQNGNPILTTYDIATRETKIIQLPANEIKNITPSKVSIDSPYFIISDIKNFTLYKGLLDRPHQLDPIQDRIFFSEAVRINNNTNIIITLKDSIREYCLASVSSNKIIKRNTTALKKQIDGLFDSDGMLHYDPVSKKIVYLFYYRNQYISMDTSLNIIAKANTIDSNRYAKIKIAPISSKKAITMSAPPMIVNRRSAINNNTLFVNSTIPSNSDTKKAFNKSSVIDVYDLQENEYKYSFYIPDFRGEKIQSVFIHDNKVFTTQGSSLLVYTFPASPSQRHLTGNVADKVKNLRYLKKPWNKKS